MATDLLDLRSATHSLFVKTVHRALRIRGVRDVLAYRYATNRFWLCKAKLALGRQVPSTFVQWLATYRCNFACRHCEASAGAPRGDELTTAEALDLVDQLGDMGVSRLLISGGEPLLRDDLFQIIGRASQRGIRYGIASNGFLTSRFSRLFTAHRPPYHFFTSIDGLEQSNDAFRGQEGAFRETLAALRFFAHLGVPSRVINTTIRPDNLDELDGLAAIVAHSAATSWRLSLMIPVGRALSDPSLFLDDAQAARVLRFVEDARRRGLAARLAEDAGYVGCFEQSTREVPFFCGAGLTRCSVMPDGEVLGCQIAYNTEHSEGNIKERSFASIWQHGFGAFRAPRFDAECLACDHFASCRGGCWGMRLGNAASSAALSGPHHCLRRVWDSSAR